MNRLRREIDWEIQSLNELDGLFTKGLFTRGLFTKGLFTKGLFTKGLFTKGKSLRAIADWAKSLSF
jgi:hypothetical protein